jgi:hypothetical protein
MIVEKKTALRSILESSEGIHLTAYLVNRGDLTDLKARIHKISQEAHEWLLEAQTPDEQKKFLEPLKSLAKDSRLLKNIKGNIGIFRSPDFFRVLNIPIDVEESLQVASSFHVKPLLRWIQGDQDFLLLGQQDQTVHLYSGSQHTFRHIDSLTGPISWINEWLSELTRVSKPRLFFAGELKSIQAIQKSIKYKNTVKTPVEPSFDQKNEGEICQKIRQALTADSREKLERALLEFRFAEADNRAKKNIFQISKAVVRGRVRKLIVTDELNIFGKIDHQSGGLAIHPVDLDHEDDCILDDLAQMVLSQGGEVVIANRDEIPKGRPILAILDEKEENQPQRDNPQIAIIGERPT